jgi:hypothetical protein
MFAYGDFFDRYTSLDTKSLSACTSIADLLHAIRDTEYAPVLGRISETSDPQLFDYATALDMYHFRTGWKDLAKIVPKDSLEAVTAGYGTKMDMLNLWYIHRARAFYRMNEAETFALLIPVRFKLRKEEIERLGEEIESLTASVKAEEDKNRRAEAFTIALEKEKARLEIENAKLRAALEAAEKAGFVSGELTATLAAEETETKAEEPEEKPIEKKSQKSRVGAMFDLLTFGDI